MELMTIEKALAELRKDKKRKFIQTVDLIVNLKNFDVRKESLNTFIQIPNPSSKKMAGFLTRKTDLVDTILKTDFDKYKSPAEAKRLSKKYDFFIAAAPLMGDIATRFGRVLGPVGKMPNPQAGIMPNDDDASIKAMVEKMKKLVRIRSKENSVKIPVGKEDLSDEQLKQNIESALHSVEDKLPRKNDNVKNVLIKFTMTKSIRVK
jgi:large subunit ribosomal protein L1